MAQKGLAPLLIIILIAAISGAGFLTYSWVNKAVDTSPPQQAACTLEAMLCPDGTSVGRSGPNCSFAPCPSPREASSSADFSNWIMYSDKEYSINLLYPPSWSLVKPDYALDKPTIRLRKTLSEKNKYPTELYIGDNLVYSTSGALCANQGCDDVGKTEVTVNQKLIPVKIVRATLNNQLDYFAFQFQLLMAKNTPYVTVRYQNDEEKEEIDQILSTFKFIQ